MTGVPQACPEALARCGNSVSRPGTRVAISVLGGKSCKVGELRDQLKKLNQSTKGKKNELIQRLESVRRNQFQAATTIKFGEGHTIMQSHHSGGEEWQEMEIKVAFGPDSNFQLPANVSIRSS